MSEISVNLWIELGGVLGVVISVRVLCFWERSERGVWRITIKILSSNPKLKIRTLTNEHYDKKFDTCKKIKM